MYQCMACKRLVDETQEGPIRNDSLCKKCAEDYEERHGEYEADFIIVDLLFLGE